MPKNYISNKDESVQMFNNPIINYFSTVHFTIPLIIFMPVCIFYLFSSFYLLNLPIWLIICFYISGIFTWTLTEYFLHRFLFHFQPKSEWGKRLHFITHGVHHQYPNDSKRLVMPPAVSIPMATLFYFLFKFIFNSSPLLYPFFAGFISGYIAYDMLHYAIHHHNFKNKIFKQLKKHHYIHHYQDDKNGFGVSSKLWDIIFKTTFKS